TQIEVLVPDFRGRLDIALDVLGQALPDVFNHNLETVPRLYKAARPGSDYRHSLSLLQRFKQRYPNIPTKSGIMVGLGETDEEIEEVMRDLRAHGCDLLTVGQYLAPSKHHLPVTRFVEPQAFERFAALGTQMGFRHVASGPMVRSSYHAEQQARGASFA
ncbi:MAG TPA: lipoyl synthase, partial [Burkholderiales bacterium]|nr:lipoyl synthase [Burkholderiales bacterium]